MKKIIVLGNGFIAGHLPYQIAKYRLTPNEEDMGWFIDEYKPDVVINATGFGGKPNVDQCEMKKTETYMANVVIPLMLAEECYKRNIHMVNLSSGCIFYSNSPHSYKTGDLDNPIVDPGWRETDFANPESHYSKTKYAADLVIGSMKNITSLRLRMPISSINHPRNLLNKLINYKKVLEQPNSITFIDDLVRAIGFVIEKEKTGIYHITSSKPITHSVLLEEYKKYVPEHTYEKISKEELNNLTIAARSNCILDNSKIIKEGFEFVDTDLMIKKTIRKFVENLRK